MTSPLTAVGEERLRETLEWLRKNYAGAPTREINTRIDDALSALAEPAPSLVSDPSPEVIYAINKWTDEHERDESMGYSDAEATDLYQTIVAVSLLACRSPVPEGDGLRPTHRHVKRGSEYVLIGYGKMQAEKRYRRHGMENAVDVDMAEVAIYRSATDPTEIWVRPRDEFEDGRFVALASPPPVKAEAEVVAVRWQREMTKRQGNRDLPDFSLPASAFPDYRMGGGGTLASTQKCIRQDCDCFDSWHCSRPAIATPSSGGRREALEEAAKSTIRLAAMKQKARKEPTQMPNEVKDERLREILAAHLCDEFDEDFQPRRSASWPEDENDDGKRSGGYVAIQPAHVRARALEAADRILTVLALRPQREDAGAGGGVADALRRISAAADRCRQVAEGNTPSTPDTARMAQYRLEEAAGLIERLAAPQPSAPVVWELEAAKHAHWEAFEGDSSGMVDDAERAKRNMRLWHAIEAALELSAAPQPSAPEGWVLVPREPTEAMMQAGLYQSSADTEWSDVYSMWVDMWDVATGRSVEVVALASPPTGRDATEEGWIEWHGSGYRDEADDLFTPVPRGHRLSVRLRSGEEFHNLPAGKSSDQIVDATGAFWRHDGSPNDIIAYRLAAPKPETAQKGGKL